MGTHVEIPQRWHDEHRSSNKHLVNSVANDIWRPWKNASSCGGGGGKYHRHTDKRVDMREDMAWQKPKK